MAGRAQLRASDLDRDRIAERLRNAAGEGRLATDELESRVESALRARTYGQLDRLVEDLPGPPGRAVTRHRSHPVLVAARVLLALTAVVAAMAVVITLVAGVIAAWWLWILAAWLLFGRRRCYHPGWHRPPPMQRRHVRHGRWA